MASPVNTYQRELRVLCTAPPALRRALLASAEPGLISCICDCAHNTLKGNVELTHVQKKKLSRHKRILRALAKPGETWKKKRATLVQKGGAILPLLVGPILSAILSSLIR